VGTFILYKVAGIEPLDIIISDDALTPAAADSIRKQGVELLLPSDDSV
jgi:DeoR/GlpR family transcriptional regulator of sugar metabolism